MRGNHRTRYKEHHKERVREWEDYHEEFKRQASRQDEARPTRDEPTDGDREALWRKLARAQADG